MAQYAIIDDTDPRLVYTGNWRILNDSTMNPLSPHYNGTVHVTNDPTATVSYQFYGTNLNVFGTIDNPATKGYPNASFVVGPNAVARTRLNETGELPRLREPTMATTHLKLFSSGRLATGTYNMTVAADGVSQYGPSFCIDFLTVLIPEGASMDNERVIVDDEDKDQWRYSSGWRFDNKPGVYLYTSHMAFNVGVSVTLPFQGTDITVYGAFTRGYNLSKSIGQFQVDESPFRTVTLSDIPNAVELHDEVIQLRNQPIFSKSGLTPGPHTLSIRVPPDSENTTRPDAAWTIDYAVFGPLSLSTTGQPSNPSPSSVPPGAIAGGVVGGLVLLGIVLLAFLLWKKKRQQSFEGIKFGEEFLSKGSSLTPYSSELTTSNVQLSGRMHSIHKPAGQQHSNPMSSISGGLSGSAHESGSAGFSPRSEEPIATSYLVPRREVDGGVRLIPSSIKGEEVLPPSYARYG